MAAARRRRPFALREKSRSDPVGADIIDMPEADRTDLRAQRRGVEIALEAFTGRGHPFGRAAFAARLADTTEAAGLA